MDDDDTEFIPWLGYDPRRPTLVYQPRTVWGFHLVHMTGDERAMRGSREHRRFHRFMNTIDTVYSYGFLAVVVGVSAFVIGVVLWAAIVVAINWP